MRVDLRRTCLLVGAACLAMSGFAAAAQQQGTRITDPAVLASLGLPADAEAYLAPGVTLGENTPFPESYGTGSPVQVSNSGVDFRGRQSTYAYNTGGGVGDVVYQAGDTFADGKITMPSGALWEGTRYWVLDGNAAADIGMFLFQACQPVAGPGAPVFTILGTGVSTGAAGNQSIAVGTAAGTTIDNNGCIYWARVRFDAVGLGLQKARSQYHLQVSPAPASATFPNDVPSTSGFFRFVEALAAAGITGGCGPGSFCPNDPVTRGQMAVFLSTALGLHFPN